MLYGGTPTTRFWRDLWMRVALRGALLVAAIFLGYEILERTVLASASHSTIYVLHLMRGMGTAFLLSTWSFIDILRGRREYDRHLQREVERLESLAGQRDQELAEAHRRIRYQTAVASLVETEDLDLERALLAFQRQHVVRALDKANGKRDAAARALGLSPATLYRHIQRLGLKGYALYAVEAGAARDR